MVNAILQADARHMPLADNSVQCCVTSPPYWGLRKYAGEQELVWNDECGTMNDECEHEWGERLMSAANDSNRGSMNWTTGGDPGSKVLGEKVSQGKYCRNCGAWRGAYGLEPVADCLAWTRPVPRLNRGIQLCANCYVCHTLLWLREAKRVLRPDGKNYRKSDE